MLNPASDPTCVSCSRLCRVGVGFPFVKGGRLALTGHASLLLGIPVVRARQCTQACKHRLVLPASQIHGQCGFRSLLSTFIRQCRAQAALAISRVLSAPRRSSRQSLDMSEARGWPFLQAHMRRGNLASPLHHKSDELLWVCTTHFEAAVVPPG